MVGEVNKSNQSKRPNCSRGNMSWKGKQIGTLELLVTLGMFRVLYGLEGVNKMGTLELLITLGMFRVLYELGYSNY